MSFRTKRDTATDKNDLCFVCSETRLLGDLSLREETVWEKTFAARDLRKVGNITENRFYVVARLVSSAIK